MEFSQTLASRTYYKTKNTVGPSAQIKQANAPISLMKVTTTGKRNYFFKKKITSSKGLVNIRIQCVVSEGCMIKSAVLHMMF